MCRTDLCDRPVLSPRHGRGRHCPSVGATWGRSYREHVSVAGLRGRDIGVRAHDNTVLSRIANKRSPPTGKRLVFPVVGLMRSDTRATDSTACNRRYDAKTGRGVPRRVRARLLGGRSPPPPPAHAREEKNTCLGRPRRRRCSCVVGITTAAYLPVWWGTGGEAAARESIPA